MTPNHPLPEPRPEDFERDLVADLELCERATPGEWGTYRTMTGWAYTTPPRPNGVTKAEHQSQWDVEFIAAARTGYPAALRLALHYRAECERAREALLDANPLVFGEDGTIDHDKPLGELVALAAERIEHLRKLHSEAVSAADAEHMEVERLKEEKHRALNLLDQAGVWTGADELTWDRVSFLIRQRNAAESRVRELEEALADAIRNA